MVFLQLPVEGFARVVLGDGVQVHRMEAALVQSRLFRQPGAHGGQRVRVGGEDHQVVVPARAGAFRIRERRLEHALGFVQVHAVAVHLQKPLLAANDRVKGTQRQGRQEARWARGDFSDFAQFAWDFVRNASGQEGARGSKG